MDTHPYNAPLAYVRPTPDMQIKVSMFVDHNGKIYLPYLHDWNPVSDCKDSTIVKIQTITISILVLMCSHRQIYWVSFKWWLLRLVNIHQFMQSQKNRLHLTLRNVSNSKPIVFMYNHENNHIHAFVITAFMPQPGDGSSSANPYLPYPTSGNNFMPYPSSSFGNFPSYPAANSSPGGSGYPPYMPPSMPPSSTPGYNNMYGPVSVLESTVD